MVDGLNPGNHLAAGYLNVFAPIDVPMAGMVPLARLEPMATQPVEPVEGAGYLFVCYGHGLGGGQMPL